MELLRNPENAKEMGRRGRDAVLERYNFGAQVKQLIKLYQQVIAETPGEPA